MAYTLVGETAHLRMGSKVILVIEFDGTDISSSIPITVKHTAIVT